MTEIGRQGSEPPAKEIEKLIREAVTQKFSKDSASEGTSSEKAHGPVNSAELNAVTSEMVTLSTNKEKSSGKESLPCESKLEIKPWFDDSSESLIEGLKDFLQRGSTLGQFKTHLELCIGLPQEVVVALCETLLDCRDKSDPHESELDISLQATRTQFGDSSESLIEDLKYLLEKGATLGQFKTHLESCIGLPQEVVDALYETILDCMDKSTRHRSKSDIKSQASLAHSGDPCESLVQGLKNFLKKGPTAHQLKAHLRSCASSNQEVVDALCETLLDCMDKSSPRESKSDFKSQASHANSDDPSDNLVKGLKNFLKKHRTEDELKAHLGSCAGSPQEVVDALFEALFGHLGGGFWVKVMDKKRYLAAAQAYAGSQMVLLGAIESFAQKINTYADKKEKLKRSDAVKKVRHVLKYLYDNEMLDEDDIFDWYQKGLAGSNKELLIWNHVKPYVEWLQHGEVDSD